MKALGHPIAHARGKGKGKGEGEGKGEDSDFHTNKVSARNFMTTFVMIPKPYVM